MNKGLKIAIGVATIGVIGTASYFIYKAIKKARDAKNNENESQEPPAVVVGGDENSNNPTPFKNKKQGDLFRQFINRFYPSYAQEIDLDVSGDSDNTFMRKAWGKYGETYKKFNPNFDKAKGNAIPKSLLDAYALRKDKGSLSNNSKGEIFIQTSSLGNIGNDKVIAYFYGSGDVSFTKAGKRIGFYKWWDNAKKINASKVNYTGTDFYNTAYKVYVALKEGDEAIKAVLGGRGVTPTFPFNGNLKSDLDAPSRKGLDLDTNIID
jgi:hypothetical protein